jgi:CheY-like chemotaxis protein
VNVLSNALKFTHQGENEVRVDTTLRDDGLHDVHWSVRDTGIGIPEGKIHTLFDAFTQADTSTTRRYGGTGLGLAICKWLCELMGGRIWAESEAGLGSTFHFTIRAEAVATLPDVDFDTHLLRGRHACLVDDNATNRRILASQLRGWGMQAHSYADPLDALDEVPLNLYDLILLDMHMPGMDGLELARRLRSEGCTAPMVLLSSIGHQIPPGESPFDAVLTKPVKQSHLQRALVQVLNHTPTAVPVAQKHTPTLLDEAFATSYPLRMLLAEDNVINQKVAQQMLKRLGYRVDVAANGREVLHLMGQQSFDVILMDVQMPEMDGLEATGYIRANYPQNGQPHIIALTANAMKEDRQRTLDAGMDDYLSKPVRPDELTAALKQAYLARHSRNTGAQAA